MDNWFDSISISLIRLPLWILSAFLISSCSLERPSFEGIPARGKKMALFFDGTNNTMYGPKHTHTNIVKMYEAVKPGTQKFYIEGVGANRKILGLATGFGFRYRIMKGYRFIAENYADGNEIYLFGFSRGAYSARMLSNFLYTVGLLDLSAVPHDKRDVFLRKLYQAYHKKQGGLVEKRIAAQTFLDRWNAERKNPQVATKADRLDVAAMGLFDSVEALGWPDYTEEDFRNLPATDLPQLENVGMTFHALALDDRRANIFTPMLFGTKETDNHTTRPLKDKLEEVWFSGCHLDVGGGVDKKFTDNAKFPLRWMLSRFKHYDLFTPVDISTPVLPPLNDIMEASHWKLLYKGKNRSIENYLMEAMAANASSKLLIHRSVLERLQTPGKLPDFKHRSNHKKALDWYENKYFKSCFTRNTVTGAYTLNRNCLSIKVVNDTP